MITKMEQILSLLTNTDIDYQLYEHPPVFTAEEGAQHCSYVPGAHVKNLFVRNKKKSAYLLVTVKIDKRVDLLSLGEQTKVGRLSFASNNDLNTMLGVEPGSVTPIAIVNDHSKNIKLFLDEDLLNEEYIAIHPLENTATISIKLQDLLSFIENYHDKVEFLRIPKASKTYCPA